MSIWPWIHSMSLFSSAAQTPNHMHWLACLFFLLLSASLVPKMSAERMRDILVSLASSHHCRKYSTSLQMNLSHRFPNTNFHPAPAPHLNKVLACQGPAQNRMLTGVHWMDLLGECTTRCIGRSLSWEHFLDLTLLENAIHNAHLPSHHLK